MGKVTEKGRLVFKEEIEGRSVELLVGASGDLVVITTQKETEATAGSFEQGSNIFPVVYSEGDPIHIEAETPDKLEEALVSDGGFSAEAAQQIANHART